MKVEPFKLMFVEEPVLTENEEAFVELRGIPPPQSLGEDYTRWGFKTILTRGGVILSARSKSCGGILNQKDCSYGRGL